MMTPGFECPNCGDEYLHARDMRGCVELHAMAARGQLSEVFVAAAKELFIAGLLNDNEAYPWSRSRTDNLDEDLWRLRN